MGLERVGTQFRIRVSSPKGFTKQSFRTLDVGRKGGFQFIRAMKKGTTKFSTQSLRVSTKDFKRTKGKLMPITPRGKRQVSSLKRQRGKVKVAIKTYF